eukprot:TRINITY_DN9947_c0_g1_i1.p1 TRINITY_DN9947_c0_g1~~TRINITY_DN9947_c0_g1_i1.p1  ORF type:complete len:383 (+),score=90.44 TRINITY_DN9947_c0_g1_i1:46-1194(+)
MMLAAASPVCPPKIFSSAQDADKFRHMNPNSAPPPLISIPSDPSLHILHEKPVAASPSSPCISSPKNTVSYHLCSAQIDAYNPGEDRLYINEKECLFAIFDGHGGDACSKYLVEKLPYHLLSTIKKNLESCQTPDYANIARWTFKKIDDCFLAENKLIARTCPTGSCGLTMMVRDDTLHMCNLGDSRVLLGSCSGSSWSHRLLTNDHNTKNEREIALVRRRTNDPNPIRGSMMGTTAGDRVGGILMVTRAFGDGLFKRKDMSIPPFISHLPYITNDPEMTTHKLQPNDKYVVISSDGLYEYFTPADVAACVEEQLEMIEKGIIPDTTKIALSLIEKQFERLSKLMKKPVDEVKKLPNRKLFMDDTTLIVLVFQQPAATPALI